MQAPDELFAFAAKGELARVEELLERGVPIDASDKFDRTALAHAATKGHLSMVDFLLRNGADPNAGKDSRRPIFYAASFGHTDIVKRLQDAGVDIDFKTDSGFTPLLAAVGSPTSDARNLETVLFLLDAGADANVTMTGPKLKKVSLIQVAKNSLNPKIAAVLKKVTQI